MAADGSVVIEIVGDDKELKKTLDSIKSTTGKALRGLATALATAGAALAGLGLAAAKVGSEFESSMAATSTMFGDVAVNTEGLKAQVLELSSATGLAATEISGSLYNALSAGIPVTEDMSGAMDYMEKCAKLAAAGFTDVDTAVTATAKVMNAYGMDLDDVDKIQKIMLQTQNKGITTVDELGATLAQVTPTAAAMGVSFENVGAALATMTAQGTPTAQATTQLNGLIAELGKNGTAAAKNLTKAADGTQYAGKSFTDMMQEGVPLNEVLNLMGDYADKSGLSMIDMFSSIEAGKAALAMAGDNSAAFASNLSAMGTEADVVGDAYAKVTDTLEHKLKTLKESVKNLGIAAYEGLKEPLKEAAGLASDAVSEIAAAFERDGLQGAVKAAGTAMSQIVGEIGKHTPNMVGAAVDLLAAFVQGLWAQRGTILKAAQEIAIALFDGIGEAVPLLAPVTKALSGLTANLKSVTPVATAAATAFVAFKVIGATTKLVQGATTAFQLARVQVALYAAANGRAAIATAAANGTFKLTEVIVALMTKQMTLAQLATAGLRAAMATAAGPIGLAVVAVSAVVGGLVAYKAMAGESEGATQSLASRLQELTDYTDKHRKSQEETATRRADGIADIQTEMGLVEDYVSELGGLIDANGRVKAGYEDRAAYLSDQINKIVPDAIAVNKDEEGSIYDINDAIKEQIFLREKEMTLEAMRDGYLTAKKEIVGAEQKVTDALCAQGAAADNVRSAQENLDKARFGTTAYDSAMTELGRWQKAHQEATSELGVARAVAQDYQDTISGYSTVGAAQSQGELEAATASLSSTIVKSNGTNQADLEKSVADMQVHYNKLLAVHTATQENMSEKDRKDSEEGIARAKATLDAQVKIANDAGIAIPKEYADGVSTGAYLYPEALQAMIDAGMRELDSSSLKADLAGVELGKNIALGMAKGMRNNTEPISMAGGFLVQVAKAATEFAAKIKSPSREFMTIGGYMGEGLAIGLKNSEGEVVKNATELSEAVLKAATDWVENKKYYNEFAAADELAFWEDLKNIAGLQGEQLLKIERNIYKARNDASKESLDHSKKWIEEEKFYKRLSAEEEVEAWERVVERKNLLTNEQLQAERNLYTAQQKMLDEQTKRVDEYEKKLAARESSLRSFAGLFAEVDKKTEVSGSQLLKNLEDQVQLFENWQKDMEKLAGSEGMTDALLAELREMGPKAAAEISALASMTEEDLARYAEKFSTLGALAKQQAEKELAVDALELPISLATVTREQAVEAVGNSVAAMCEAAAGSTEQLRESVGSMANAMCESFLAKRPAFYQVGMDAMQGLNEGLRIQGQAAIETARGIANAIIFEMQRALDIHSPSRKMRDLVGKPAAQGIFVGFEDEMRRFHRIAQDTVDRETGKINAQVSAQVAAKQGAQPPIREVHHNTRTIEKVVGVESTGSFGEIIRALNITLKAEDRRVGASFA